MNLKSNMLKPVTAWMSITMLIPILTTGCSFVSSIGKTDRGSAQQQMEETPEIGMMLVLNSAELPRDTIVKTLEEKTGTKLSFTWVPDNIYTDKMVSAIAGGTLPEAVQIKSVDMKHPSVVNGIRSGMFWEIGPLLKEYPYISKYMNPMIMDNGSYFGKYYGLYWERPLSRQGIQYRKDWLERLGLKEPQTIEELYTVLKAFTYGDPDGNGKQDTYGLIDRNDLVYGAFKNLASYFGTPNNWGLVNKRLIPDFMTMEYLETTRFMKKLYDEKIINPDFTITSKVQQENRFVNGEAGMMISNVVAASIRDRIKKSNPAADIEIQNRIRGPKGDRIWGGSGMGGQFLFPKKSVKTEAELKAILSFFDRTLSEDVNNLITYGLQDRHYNLINEKTIKIMPNTKTLREVEVEPYANALRTADIRYLQLGENGSFQQKINAMTQDNNNIVVQDPTAALVSPTQAEKGTELQTIITDATYQFILGKLDETGFNRELDKWRQNGGNLIIDEMNSEYAAFNK
ncbi:extracellular solute-binding protein [Paenibacillus sp. LMG 31456]|uniref:Extracellular solute-binding protein n=1 Tax=Paenibacillus foliorum TaxID=2654974 RepID=A0A972K1F3_9BACL|nr:extracellular solute-binding protein [Paenibacillus foliorum]NOU94795.1 extracellular solute-binding protein [Paenibacillus foliorum]